MAREDEVEDCFVYFLFLKNMHSTLIPRVVFESVGSPE
jgi:hypothetical protein